MIYKKLSDTTMQWSVLGLGTWVFSGDAWGRVDDQMSSRVIKAALDHGVNVIDTAPVYGRGHAEKIVGESIQPYREKVYVASKCGIEVVGKKYRVNLSPDFINKEIEASLRRLRTDYIDLYQCHWPDRDTPFEQTWPTLLKLKKQGKIRNIGLSNYTLADLKAITVLDDVLTLQSQCSLLHYPQVSDEIEFCQNNGLGFIAYGALCGGALTGKYQDRPKLSRKDARSYFYKISKDKPFARAQRLVQFINQQGFVATEAAINWVRAIDGVQTVLVGARTLDQLNAHIQALGWFMKNEDWLTLRNHVVNDKTIVTE